MPPLPCSALGPTSFEFSYQTRDASWWHAKCHTPTKITRLWKGSLAHSRSESPTEVRVPRPDRGSGAAAWSRLGHCLQQNWHRLTPADSTRGTSTWTASSQGKTKHPVWSSPFLHVYLYGQVIDISLQGLTRACFYSSIIYRGTVKKKKKKVLSGRLNTSLVEGIQQRPQDNCCRVFNTTSTNYWGILLHLTNPLFSFLRVFHNAI